LRECGKKEQARDAKRVCLKGLGLGEGGGVGEGPRLWGSDSSNKVSVSVVERHQIRLRYVFDHHAPQRPTAAHLQDTNPETPTHTRDTVTPSQAGQPDDRQGGSRGVRSKGFCPQLLPSDQIAYWMRITPPCACCPKHTSTLTALPSTLLLLLLAAH
jgi:hypothetical protein